MTLHVRDADMLRRRVHVRQAVAVVRGSLVCVSSGRILSSLLRLKSEQVYGVESASRSASTEGSVSIAVCLMR